MEKQMPPAPEPSYDDLYGEAGAPDWGSGDDVQPPFHVRSETPIASLGLVWPNLDLSKQAEARRLFIMGSPPRIHRHRH